MSAKGFGIGASDRPMDDRRLKKGEELGDNWLITGSQGASALRMVQIDTNHWKSFLHARLAVPIGDTGCLSLWGKSEARHRMLAEQLTAEYPVRTEGRGRLVNEWSARPGRDNHLLDCATGCMVAGSMLGIRLMARAVPKKTKKKFRTVKATYL